MTRIQFQLSRSGPTDNSRTRTAEMITTRMSLPHDCIKLSVQETGESIIWLRKPDTFVDYPEEPSESIKSCNRGIQTEPIRSCSTETFVDCPEEPSESIKSCDGGFQTEPNQTCFAVFFTARKLFKPYRGPFKWYFSHDSQYDKDHPKEPTGRLLVNPSYVGLQKSDSFFRGLLPAVSFSTTLVLKVLLTSLLHIVVSEAQSLRYHHTGVFHQDELSFEFHAVGFVNNHQIDKYDHITKRDVPVASWMEKQQNKSYWDRETNYRRGWEKVFKDNLRILMHRLNGSTVFLTLQLMYGCDCGTDGSIRGYYQYALNGRDFLYLDNISMQWQPAANEAEISAKSWNTDPDIAKSVTRYLTQHCTSALKRYVTLGEQALNNNVRPEVKVWGRRESNKVTKLYCLVYGFHPRAVHVKWVRNGVDDVPSDEMSPILPHPDGTYQIRVSAEVPTREGDTYSCHVEHSSLEETLSVKWEVNHHNKSLRAALLSASFITVLILIFSMLLTSPCVIAFEGDRFPQCLFFQFQARRIYLRSHDVCLNINLSAENCPCF